MTILEFLAVAIPSLAAGAGIMKLALKNKKFAQKIDRSDNKKYEAINNPEILLEKLTKNGPMYDDGDEVSFVVEVKDGEKKLVQKIKKNVVAPGVKGMQQLKNLKTTKKVAKKVAKKGGNKDGRKKG